MFHQSLALLFVSAGLVIPASAATTAGWSSMPLAGGAEPFARVLGIPTPLDCPRLMLETVRRLYGVGRDGAPDPSLLEGVLAHLAAAEAADGDAIPDEVPLPLSVATWNEEILERAVPPQSLVRTILGTRKTALLYYGLAGVNPETLAFLEQRHDLIEFLHDHAPAFAAFGPSFHVRNGVVQTPGGPGSVPLWESLVDERVNKPDGFARELFGKGQGRLAYFYGSLAHLTEAQQGFALGSTNRNGKARLQRFKDLYAVFLQTNARWVIQNSPLWRPWMEPGHVLALTSVDSSGNLRPPAWRDVWENVFGAGGRIEVNGDGGPAIDAAWLVQRICLTEILNRGDLLEGFLFAQRVFGEVPRAQAPTLAAALRGFLRYRSLMLTLERIGVHDPAVYEAAAVSAAQLGDLGEREAAIALTGFQSALALIDRARQSRAIGQDGALKLVRSLLALSPANGDLIYSGALAEWIRSAFVEDARQAMGVDSTYDAESVVLRVLAGAAATNPVKEGDNQTRVQWEGQAYRVDLGFAELRRLERVRRKQAGNTLDGVLALAGAARTLLSTHAPGEMPECVAAIEAAARQIQRVRFSEHMQADPSQLIERAGELVASKRIDSSDTDDLARDALMLSEIVLADVLRSLAYATALGDPDGPALLGSNVARRHDFSGVGESAAGVAAAWEVPREENTRGGTWHLVGSLLGLDVGLARLSLRRLGMAGSIKPTTTDNDRRAFAQAVSLMNPIETTGERRNAIVDALRDGRERAAALTPERVQDAARDAGIGERRHRALDWVVVHEREHLPGFFSAAELVWLGRPDGWSAADLDPFGTSGLPFDGRLGLHFPPKGAWEDSAGQGAAGLLAARVPDVTLLLLEWMADRDVPAAVTRDVLRAVTQDYIDTAAPADQDDWWSLVNHARSLDEERLQDYVAALVASGPLVPQ